jgi:2-aminoethylphosphonate-pyruvate transaminase
MAVDRSPILLTPGPVTTSPGVRAVMQQDCCTWASEYVALVDDLRQRLVRLAVRGPAGAYTCVLLQGTGSYAVEATLGSVIPPSGKVLIVDNGAYGRRMVFTAEKLKLAHAVVAFPETETAQRQTIERALAADAAITHLAVVHSETTTGIVNPVAEIGRAARALGKTVIVDAVSSFGGLPLSMEELGAHYLVSTASKCLQGVPGLGLVVAERAQLERTRGWARSLAFDLYDQWQFMESQRTRWRFTSPTFVVRALAQAVRELEEEGGVAARHQRYENNHRRLVRGMTELGFQTLLPPERQSAILTSFRFPTDPAWSFDRFYEGLKARGFILYPGKVSLADAFRIGTIGNVFPEDFLELTRAASAVLAEMGVRPHSIKMPAS